MTFFHPIVSMHMHLYLNCSETNFQNANYLYSNKLNIFRKLQLYVLHSIHLLGCTRNNYMYEELFIPGT